MLLVLACASRPAPLTKPNESRAMVSSTRTVHSDAAASAQKTIPQRSGRASRELLGDLQATVAGVQHKSGIGYLRVRLNDNAFVYGRAAELSQAVCEPNIRCQAALLVEPDASTGDRQTSEAAAGNARGRGIAAPAKPAAMRAAHGPELLLRISDSAGFAQLSSVTLRSYRSGHGGRGGLEQVVRLSGLDSAPEDADLDRDFATSWAAFIHRFGDGEPFAEFAAARMQRQSLARSGSARPGAQRPSPRVDLHALMDFYTGQSEVRRTLQTDRGLGTSWRALPKTIDLARLRSVQHEPRDYRALLAGDAGAQRFVPHPLAGSIPNDALVVEFGSVKELVSLPRRLDQRLGRILAALEGQPGDNLLLERYRTQLIVEQTSLAEKLGHVAIGTVALVVGDPYLREGTDVSLLFEVRERKLLEAALAGFVANARRAHPDLESKQLVVADMPVLVHQTADGRLRRYEAWIGPNLVISNSRGALEHILDVQRDKASRLALSSDYQWARSMAPFAAEAERAFLFFGDAFVAKITGPRSKILEARRARAQSELRSVEYAALLFGWMQGAPAQSLDELLASGWLTKADMVHFDGSPINFDPRRGASSRFGAADDLLPIIDLGISKIDTGEASAYEDFRSEYERGLRGALDPTTLRFLRKASDEQWSTELRILPLSPGGELGSQFREIVRTVGRGAIDPGTSPDGLRAVLGISRESPLRELADGVVHGTLRGKELTLGFLGDWVEAGIVDDPWLWNFAVAKRLLPELEDKTEDRSAFGIEQNLHRVPLWAAAHVKSPMLLTAALAALRFQSRESLGDWVSWHDGDKYRDLGVTRVEIHPSGGEESSVVIHFTLVKDVLVLSLDRRILEQRVDEVLAGHRPKGVDVASGASQLVLGFERGTTRYLTEILGSLLDAPGILAHRRACIALSLLAAGIGEDAANSAERSRLGLRILGVAPESPAGPGLSIDHGQCNHPVYGTELEPVVPDGRDEAVPLHAAVRQLQALRMGLAVVPRGDEQEFVGRVEFEWR
jgi:hypothetical protein